MCRLACFLIQKSNWARSDDPFLLRSLSASAIGCGSRKVPGDMRVFGEQSRKRYISDSQRATCLVRGILDSVESVIAVSPAAGVCPDPTGSAARFRKIDGAPARNHTAMTESNTMHPSEDVRI